MGSYSDVVEISSEEEDANDNNSCMKTNSNGSDDPLNWLDELIIMEEISDPPAVAPKKSLLPKTLSFSDDVNGGGGGDADDDDADADDDDCQVLDFDPDKSVVAVSADKVDESDEIEIVGAKGEVACRDFPHPRHLCANFPFDSTSHDKYCRMCHCYVCDSPAPCMFWGNLVNLDSHCHATEKNPTWKKRRDSNKAPSLQKTPPQLVTPGVMPVWHPLPHKSYGPNPYQVSRPSSIQIPYRRSTNIGPITTGSMHGHRSGPYFPARSHQLTRSNSMHTYSVNMFKQDVQPCYPVLSAHQTQPVPMLNRPHSTSNESLLRSLSAAAQNSAMQRSQNQSGAYVQGNLADVASKSWKDILDSVASELGVSDYSVNTSGVQQSISSVPLAMSGTLDGTKTGNLPTNAQPIDSTTGQNTANLNANSMSENLHANVQDIFESVVSSPLYGFEEHWIDSPNFS